MERDMGKWRGDEIEAGEDLLKYRGWRRKRQAQKSLQEICGVLFNHFHLFNPSQGTGHRTKF